jgi:hypothetical protein
MPPFQRMNPDVRVELFEALRMIVREEVAALRQDVAAA